MGMCRGPRLAPDGSGPPDDESLFSAGDVGWREGPVGVDLGGVHFGLTAAETCWLPVIECKQPARTLRRGRGKSDLIDAHLAVLSAAAAGGRSLAVPRADGDREALRILLGARHDLTTSSTAQVYRLRALLRSGEDTDTELARGPLSETVLTALARRRLPRAPTGNRQCGRPRSGAWPWPCGTPVAR
jgi:hypothetical protein